MGAIRRLLKRDEFALEGHLAGFDRIGFAGAAVPGINGRSDGRRRQAIADARCLHVGVTGSTVTLSGTLRNWAEIRAARETAWSAPGVTQVVDQMLVGP